MTEPGGRLDLRGTKNVRDLGGLPVASGAAIRPGRLLRAEALVSSNAHESYSLWDGVMADDFTALGLRTVIDLRATREAEAAASAWDAATGARRVAIPIDEGVEGTDTDLFGRILSGDVTVFTDADMGDFYIKCLDRRAADFGRVFALIADDNRLPALVHCAAGKDRTGLLVALVLAVLGTSRDVIVDDYTLTGRLLPDRADAYRSLFDATGIVMDHVRLIFETPELAMHMALDHLDTTYGGADEYLLRRGGITPAQIEAVRRNLTT